MAVRSYTEFSNRMAAITTVPCPDCGMAFPCGTDADQSRRMAHYAQECPGKPAPAEKPLLTITQPNYKALTTASLKALRNRMRARLQQNQKPVRFVRIDFNLLSIYQQILDTVEAELARREGDIHHG